MPVTPFVITCNGRDGSTFTQTSLDQHPNVVAEKELLISTNRDQHERAGSATTFLNQRLYGCEYRPEIQAVGFRLKWFHGQKPPLDDVRDYLHQLNVKVIHIQRRNFLKNYLSGLIADQTNVWVDFSGSHSSSSKVAMNPEKAIEYFRHQVNRYQQNQNDFKDHESITVIYEEILADYDGQMARLFEFLNVPNHKVRPRTFKQEHRPLSEIITNYQELKAALQPTTFKNFLDDKTLET